MKNTDALKVAAEMVQPAENTMSSWGLPDQKRLPLDTPEFVERSISAFESESEKLSAMDKVATARRIRSAATAMKVKTGGGLVDKLAGESLSPHFETYMKMRDRETAALFGNELQGFVDRANEIDGMKVASLRMASLDKLASDVEEFDRRNDLHGAWGYSIPDPAYSVYGPLLDWTANIGEASVKVGSFDVTEDVLSNADWSVFEDKLSSTVIDGIKDSDDKLSIFESLPAPEREIIAQHLR